MTWTYCTPVGTLQDTVTIGRATWELYRGNIGWEVFSFVRTENTTGWTSTSPTSLTTWSRAAGWTKPST